MKSRISEVFSSIQGEGTLIGRRQVFVRFSGCNLSCNYCDTSKSRDPLYGDEISTEELYKKVNGLLTPDFHSISFTGGEPLLHVIGVMEENNIGKVVVIRDNEPVGMITPENISFAYVEDPETGVNVEKIYFLRNSEEGKSKKNVRMVSMLTAGDIMQNGMIKISGDEDAAKAADMMIREDIGGLSVVEGDDLTGIITKTDIIKGIQ